MNYGSIENIFRGKGYQVERDCKVKGLSNIEHSFDYLLKDSTSDKVGVLVRDNVTLKDYLIAIMAGYDCKIPVIILAKRVRKDVLDVIDHEKVLTLRLPQNTVLIGYGDKEKLKKIVEVFVKF